MGAEKMKSDTVVAESSDENDVKKTSTSGSGTAGGGQKVVRLPKPDRTETDSQILQLNNAIEAQQLRITAVRDAIDSKKGIVYIDISLSLSILEFLFIIHVLIIIIITITVIIMTIIIITIGNRKNVSGETAHVRNELIQVRAEFKRELVKTCNIQYITHICYSYISLFNH